MRASAAKPNERNEAKHFMHAIEGKMKTPKPLKKAHTLQTVLTKVNTKQRRYRSGTRQYLAAKGSNCSWSLTWTNVCR